MTAGIDTDALPAPPRDIAPAVARRAVAWLVELQENADEDVGRRWRQWLAAHPDHARAWNHIEAVNARLGASLALPGGAALARTTLAAGGRSRRQVLKVLSVLAATGGAAWIAREPARAWTADLRTAVGERRSLRLADGSALSLNTDSAVDLLFSASERRLRLLRGEVLIATAADARPLVVETAVGEVRPIGTRFLVRDASGRGEAACRVRCVHPRC